MATITGESASAAGAVGAVERTTAFGPMALAGIASLGAGAIHATAIGVHGEHDAAARAFAALAAAQLAWGALALVARRTAVAVAGIVLGAVAVGGWVLAKTTGISFVDGLGEVEEIQLADAAAAALAALATVLLVRNLVSGLAGRDPARPRPAVLGGVGVAVLAASLVAMTAAGAHSHAGGHDDGTAHAAAAHTDSEPHADGEAHTETVALPTREYDPAAPIDLSGVPGVTPAQQARAENLIAITLDRLPRYADPAVAEAAGFRSIGDGFTGHEHYINWDYISDEHILNPDFPESLVYETGPGGSKTLVSAMFMTNAGASLDEVPELGGALTQWHVHDDLCFTDDPENPRVAGVTSVGGTCRPPLQKFAPTPMIHGWITKHPCGPFAALEGVAAGQVQEGEEHLCDTLHGGH